MSTIVLRNVKGSALTFQEGDDNFTNLNNDKLELTDLSVGAEGTASGDGAISYNNTTGVFTYTPPDLSGYLTSYTETDPVVGAVNGLVKADGAGNISAAVAGTDYLASYTTELSEDTTPQLGGDLDLNSNDITGTGSINITGNAIAQSAINAQTGASYTLVLGDASKLITMSNGSSNTLTIPPNSSVAFPVGTKIDIAQIGAGQTTVAAGAGVTVNATPSLLLRAQYSAATCIKTATDTWLLVGDLETP